MEVPDPELKKIFGKWDWISSTGGIAGKPIGVSSYGDIIQLEFGRDGTYKKFKNDSLIDQKKFSFSQATSIQNHEPVWVVSPGESSLKMAVSFSGSDTLMLNEQVHDGFEHVYVRIK